MIIIPWGITAAVSAVVNVPSLTDPVPTGFASKDSLTIPFDTVQDDEKTQELLEDLRTRVRDLELKHEQELEDLRTELDLMLDMADPTAGSSALNLTPAVNAGNAFNPRITVFGNFLGRLDDRTIEVEGEEVDDQFSIREVEFDFRAAIGPWADGVLIFAAEAEVPGDYESSVEEGFVIFKRLPFLDGDSPAGLTLTAGRFRSFFSRMNRLHLHDLPVPTRAPSLVNILGEEGFVSDGLRATWFLPSPSDRQSLQATVELVNGGGNAIASEGSAEGPAGVARVQWTMDVDAATSLDVGVSGYRGRHNGDGRAATMIGADASYQWRPNRRHSLLVATEAFYGSVSGRPDDPGDPDEEEAPPPSPSSPFGVTTMVQTQISQTMFLSGRYDWFETLFDERNETQQYGLYLTHYSTEFLRLRLGYEHTRSDVAAIDGQDTGYLEIQFIFGSHPTHPWWANL